MALLIERAGDDFVVVCERELCGRTESYSVTVHYEESPGISLWKLLEILVRESEGLGDDCGWFEEEVDG